MQTRYLMKVFNEIFVYFWGILIFSGFWVNGLDGVFKFDAKNVF